MSTRKASREAALETLGVETANTSTDAEAITYHQAFKMLDSRELRGTEKEKFKEAVMGALEEEYKISARAKNRIDLIIEHPEYDPEDASDIVDSLENSATEEEALRENGYTASGGRTG